ALSGLLRTREGGAADRSCSSSARATWRGQGDAAGEGRPAGQGGCRPSASPSPIERSRTPPFLILSRPEGPCRRTHGGAVPRAEGVCALRHGPVGPAQDEGGWSGGSES